MLTASLTLIAGLVVLIGGGEFMVRGAVQIAERLGLSQLLIGLTVIAFGTSAPELVASLEAASRGAPGIAWGNIVGSNITNSLLILGLASVVYPMAVQRGPLWRDGGLALVATAILTLIALSSGAERWMGFAAIALLLLYLIYAYFSERASGPGASAASEKRDSLIATDGGLLLSRSFWLSLASLLGGLAAIIVGGRWLVGAAVELAEYAGLSQTVIGLTVIAIGTSLPEAVTAVIAAMKRASAVALGNVLGSNIFNLLLIGGTTSIVAPGPLPAELVGFSLPFLLLTSVLLLIFAATGYRIKRWEGAVLMAAFFGQLGYSLLA